MMEIKLKVKLYMTSGSILYWPGNILEMRSFINSANARGGNVGTGYKNVELTEEVQFVLSNVEYFEQV